MAVLDLRGRVCAERASLHLGMHHQRAAVHALPGDPQGHDHPSCPVHVHWHISHGSGHDHQHDLFRVCTCLGRMDTLLCLGTVDIRRRGLSDDGSVSAIPAVSISDNSPCLHK